GATLYRGQVGQLDHEAGAAARVVLDPDLAAHAPDQPVDQEQAEADPADPAGRGGVELGEGGEDALAVDLGPPLPPVGDLDPGQPRGWVTSTWTGVPGGACLPALSTRLPTTIRSASASPRSDRGSGGGGSSTRRPGAAPPPGAARP